jgi:hypothetical protein
VDFDGPIHNGITTYRPRSWAARPQSRQPSGQVGTVVVTDRTLRGEAMLEGKRRSSDRLRTGRGRS